MMGSAPENAFAVPCGHLKTTTFRTSKFGRSKRIRIRCKSKELDLGKGEEEEKTSLLPS